MIVRCATFSKRLSPRNIEKSVSDILIRMRFAFESNFWISVSGCKLTILPDIQPANRIVIISARYTLLLLHRIQRYMWSITTPHVVPVIYIHFLHVIINKQIIMCH